MLNFTKKLQKGPGETALTITYYTENIVQAFLHKKLKAFDEFSVFIQT